MRRQLHRGGLGRCLAAARSGFFWLRAINLWRFLFWRARIAVALWHPLAARAARGAWSSERAESLMEVQHKGIELFSLSVMLSEFVTATHLQRRAWILQYRVPVVALTCVVRVVCCWWVWMVVRFVCVVRVPLCARVSRVCPVCVPAPPRSFYRVDCEYRLAVNFNVRLFL
jgi:hypothetical protein